MKKNNTYFFFKKKMKLVDKLWMKTYFYDFHVSEWFVTLV